MAWPGLAGGERRGDKVGGGREGGGLQLNRSAQWREASGRLSI